MAKTTKSRKTQQKTPKEPLGTRAGSRVIRLSLILGLITTASTGGLFVLLGKAIDAAHDGTTVGGGTIAGIIILALLSTLIVGFSLFLTQTSAAWEELHLRRKLVHHLMDLGTQERSAERTGSIVSLLTDDTERIAYYRQTFLGPMIGSMLAPVITILMIGFRSDWEIAGWLSLTIPAVPRLISSFEMVFRKVSGKTVSARWELSSTYLDAIQGLTTLRTFRAAKRISKQLSDIGENNRVSMMKLLFGNQLVIFVVDAVFSLAMITLSTFLAYQALKDGDITVGQSIAVVLLSTIMLEPLDRIGQFFYVGMGGLAAQRKARAFLAEKSAYQVISDEKRAADPAIHADAAASAQPGAITLHNVTFAYSADDDAKQVLHDLTLDIAPGEHVGLVGTSGGGKSTLAGLVLGDLVPRTGSVTVDGKIVGEVPAAQIRSGTAAVNQTTWLFTGTLADNLRIAKPDATEEEMWKALETAALADDIRTMPEQLNTEVGERGYSLSGGQAQRLAIARAILADAPIMVFDEPTSHVDINSEAAILASMEEVGRDKTVLTIAHRPTALRDVDRILVLRDGTLVEEKHS